MTHTDDTQMTHKVMRKTHRTMTARLVTAIVVAAMTVVEEPPDVIRVMVVAVETLALTRMDFAILP